MDNLADRTFGYYHLIQPLGEGGMASVWLGEDSRTGFLVAVKVLPQQFATNDDSVARFYREARILGSLHHPHILSIFSFGEVDGYPYIVMPVVRRGTVANALHGVPLPLPGVVRIVTQVGQALDHAHAQGIVHRDVKPSNILIGEDDGYLLTDFGIAKLVEATTQLTGTGSLIGTPTYMSPEQCRGEVLDARSDIYSLGVVMFQLATGRLPYEANTPVGMMFKHTNAPLPSARALNPKLPRTAERVIARAMAKRPGDRFMTAAEMVKAVQALTVEKVAVQTVIAGPPRPPSPTLVRPQASFLSAAWTRLWHSIARRSGSQTPPAWGAKTPQLVIAITIGMVLISGSVQVAPQNALSVSTETARLAAWLRAATPFPSAVDASVPPPDARTPQALTLAAAAQPLATTAQPSVIVTRPIQGSATATATASSTQTPSPTKTRVPSTPTLAPTATPTLTPTATLTLTPTAAATAGLSPGQLQVVLMWPPAPEVGIVNRPPMLRWRLYGPVSGAAYQFQQPGPYCPGDLESWEEGPLTIQVWPTGEPNTWIVNFAGSLQATQVAVQGGEAEFTYVANQMIGQKPGRYEWRVIMRCYYQNNRVPETLPVAEAVAYGAFWFDASADVTPTPYQSPTPNPTLTPIPSWDPFASHGPLSILKVELDSSARDATRPNGAIAQLRANFVGGAAPYSVSVGGIQVAAGLIPAPRFWIVFPVQTSCGADLVNSIQLSSADGQSATLNVFIPKIPC